MIPRQNRFHGLGSVRPIYRHGQTVRNPLCSLKFKRASKRDTFRCAVVVSRKVNKSAVVRNRIRRRIYEIIRLQASQIKEPFDLVFTVFGEQMATMPAEELQQLIVTLLKQAKIIQN